MKSDLCLRIILTSALWAGPALGSALETQDLLEMSLEDLINVKVAGAGSLTETSRRMSPSTLTTITQEDILASGARNLYELLEIYVPNFTWVSQNGEKNHMGLRGIMSDRDDKYLMLVNGKVMNIHTEMGAVTERDLPTLRDIHHIDVVRGPGSALYGPGAVAMVISIVTEDSRSFEGMEATVKAGSREQFISGEVKFGKALDKDRGLYLFVGASDYPGVSAELSPLYYPAPTTFQGRTYAAGEPIKHPGNDGFSGTLGNWPRIKMHGSYRSKDLEFWTRFTTGSEHEVFSGNINGGNYYSQWTNVLQGTHALRDDLSWSWMASFDQTCWRTIRNYIADTAPRRSFSEREYLGKTSLTWTPNASHSLALGSELSYEQFGLPWGGPFRGLSFDEPPVLVGPMDRWDTQMLSVFGEWQWQLSPVWTLFVGGRGDKHTHTDSMWSPRATLVYTMTPKDTLKLIASRSLRTNLSYYMREAVRSTGEDSPPEQLKAYEIQYQRMQTENFSLAGNLFFHDHAVMEWNSDPAVWGPDIIGNALSYGVELEAQYKTKHTRFLVSHCIVKLTDMELRDETINQRHSAAPYGFGNDFASWPCQLTKVALHRDLLESLSCDGSLMINWPVSGGYDFARYHVSQGGTGYTRNDDLPFRTTAYLNLGLQYKPDKQWTFRVDGHHLLGLFDREWNRRNQLAAPGGLGKLYQHHTPSISLTVIGRFK